MVANFSTANQYCHWWPDFLPQNDLRESREESPIKRFTIYIFAYDKYMTFSGVYNSGSKEYVWKTKHYLLIDIQINAVMFEGRMQQPSRLRDVDI